jgi:flagellar biosynthesis/type III secretory pathway M-ring protein FliF/YscJ
LKKCCLCATDLDRLATESHPAWIWVPTAVVVVSAVVIVVIVIGYVRSRKAKDNDTDTAGTKMRGRNELAVYESVEDVRIQPKEVWTESPLYVSWQESVDSTATGATQNTIENAT